MIHSHQHEVQSVEETAGRNLTPRQKESMQVLIKALSDFLLEDRNDAESITNTVMDYEEDDMYEEKPRKKSSTQYFQESNRQRLNPTIAPSCSDDQASQGVIRACGALITESERFEYSLRTLGAGGPGMYGTWLLRRHLRSFLEVFQTFNIDALREGPKKSRLSERYTLDCYIEKLPEPLSELRNAFRELDSSLMGFVAFFCSTDLRRVFRSIIRLLWHESESLRRLEGREYIPPDEVESIRTELLTFFSDMERHFQTCSAELSDYRKQGVPLIQAAQYSRSDRYLMLTTISTFFSAVTSATLQMALEQDPGSDNAALGTAVNLFFYLSLIFSIASAVQALLAMSWMRSFIRVPYEKLAFQWVSKSPLFSLVMSGAFFAIGLCLFVIASEKTSLTTFFTIVFAFLHATGLISTSVWFVYEQWKFRITTRTVGRKLTDTSVLMSLLARIHKLFWKKNEQDGKDRSSENPRPQTETTTSSDASVIDIQVEPPSRTGSVVSFIDPIDSEPIHPQALVDGEQFTHRGAPENRSTTLVDGVSSSYALPYPAFHQVLQSADLQSRQETWEESSPQESISYMEMYNRRNPRKKRTYPPFEPPQT